MVVHAGIEENQFLAAVPPIYQTSTFGFDSAEQGAATFSGSRKGYIYSRMGNPTVEALENAVAVLERGAKGLACGSGMAAIHTALAAELQSGDHVVCTDAVYGPTCTLLNCIMSRFGVESTMVDTSDLDAVRAAVRPNTKLFYVETPGNPTLVVSDLAAIAGIAHQVGARLIVDNTFLSPVLQRPLEFGADVVVHSLTKFLNGHADVVGGVIVVKDDDDYPRYRKALNHFGGVLPPFESFLVHRGIKTLALRIRRHCESALKIAKHLEQHPQIEWVRYPFLESHPQYELSRKQTTGGGAVISFGLKGGVESGRKMMNAVQLCMLAVSLGGVESLIQHPAGMTHASMGVEARRKARIDDGMVRVSVGIEDPDDIINDLERGLAAAASNTTPCMAAS
jgi:methionine-gamma-lyase